MFSKKQSPGDLEADPYIRIQFTLEKSHGTCSIHEADCGLKTLIGGLKEDMEYVFGASSKSQKWFYNATQLEDGKTLLQYDIRKNTSPKINVKISTN